MNSRDERRAERTVAKQLRRSTREQERTLRRRSAEGEEDRSVIREKYKKKSAARLEKRNMFRTMTVSSLIILCAFMFFEVLLVIMSGGPGDLNTHLLNLADNSLAFVVGLTAMDAVMYISQLQSRRRGESRAIIRHNRIVQPAIDMYLARKNMMITPPGEDVKTFQIVSGFRIRDLKDMYGPSEIVTDAGRTKIETFRVQTKNLHKAFINMVEDIDFDFNPEICDAAMRFINATTYGTAALDSLIVFEDDGMRSKRMVLIKQMKEEEESGSLADAKAELKNVYLVQQMIQEQEAAIKEYLTTINEMTEDRAKGTTYDHYE